MKNMTYTYMLLGNSWAYPGQSKNPSARYEEHLAGKCPTTALHIKADGRPPLMVPMPMYNYDLDNLRYQGKGKNGECRLQRAMLVGKYVPEGYEVLRAAWPYLSIEASRRGARNQPIEARRRAGRNGGPAAQVIQRVMRVGFYNSEVQRKSGRKGARSQPIEARRRAQRNGGHASQAVLRAMKVGFYSFEVQRKGGRKSGHNQWHVARGIVSPTCTLCAR